MGNYITKKSEMKFKNQETLKAAWAVIDEADSALNDRSRKMKDSPISDVIAGAVGVGIGAGIGFAGLYFGGCVVGLGTAGVTAGLMAAGEIVGGGMAAGVAVVAAPAVLLGGAALLMSSHSRNEKLRESKELLYKKAIAKQTEIIKALKEERDADKERIDYLNGLNILLQSIIKDLQHDLGIVA